MLGWSQHRSLQWSCVPYPRHHCLQSLGLKRFVKIAFAQSQYFLTRYTLLLQQFPTLHASLLALVAGALSLILIQCLFCIGENGVLDQRWARLQRRITEGGVAEPPVLAALVPRMRQLLIKPGSPQAEHAAQVVIVNSVTGRTDRRTKGELVQQLSRRRSLWAPPLAILVSSDMMVSIANCACLLHCSAA